MSLILELAKQINADHELRSSFEMVLAFTGRLANLPSQHKEETKQNTEGGGVDDGDQDPGADTETQVQFYIAKFTTPLVGSEAIDSDDNDDDEPSLIENFVFKVSNNLVSPAVIEEMIIKLGGRSGTVGTNKQRIIKWAELDTPADWLLHFKVRKDLQDFVKAHNIGGWNGQTKVDNLRKLI